MYIPERWKDKTTVNIASNGWSPADVTMINTGGENLYLKSIDVKYATTTYSIKREKEVMQWLAGKLIVPKVIDSGSEDNHEFMVMSELKGIHIDDFKSNPEVYVTHLANAIKRIQNVDVTDCPFDSRVDVRLDELRYLINSGLASIDDWEESTAFTDINEFYKWLCDNKPQEELVFSHGDLTANMFINGSGYCYYDLGRAGKADKWLDIAFCVNDIREYKDKKYETMFFDLLNIQPDNNKIEYFILLDEMF